MKILFIGDIVGSKGRAAVKKLLPSLRQSYDIDVVIANGENAAHGKGITKKIYDELLGYGIDVITLGNHAFSKADLYDFIASADRLVRPLNLVPTEFGQGILEIEVKGVPLVIVNVVGNVFMDDTSESPFELMKRYTCKFINKVVVVDMHAEATSEKIAFAYMYQNCLSAVVGTHTHVQTADEKIMNGCAFISDVGMTGPYDSVIGREVAEVLDRFNGIRTNRFTVAEGEAQFCALFIEVDNASKRAVNVERIQIRPQDDSITHS
ncbi:MAG: TIGR00282 family metallophosphoesterase [Erysipelotrichaceae bacterium]